MRIQRIEGAELLGRVSVRIPEKHIVVTFELGTSDITEKCFMCGQGEPLSDDMYKALKALRAAFQAVEQLGDRLHFEVEVEDEEK